MNDVNDKVYLSWTLASLSMSSNVCVRGWWWGGHVIVGH